ncbi:MAG: hypothetical protein HY613_07650 [Candidatus Rokubacteria bacterium]|nr:hypothetical protein [Candidatus Rokubacteria bacterium]
MKASTTCAGPLLILLLGTTFPSSVQAQPVPVSIAQLVGSPEQYAGKEVVLEGTLSGDSPTQMLLPPSPFQLVLTDPSGAQLLVLTRVDPHRIRRETMLSIHGTFYHIPLDTGRALQFVVPRPGGLMAVLPWWH